MNEAIVVDAGIWLASFIQNDYFCKASSEWLKAKHKQGIDLYAPVLLLTEVASVISR